MGRQKTGPTAVNKVQRLLRERAEHPVRNTNPGPIRLRVSTPISWDDDRRIRWLFRLAGIPQIHYGDQKPGSTLIIAPLPLRDESAA